MAEMKLVVSPENTALIIHDMENGFWKPPYTDSNKAESIIGPIQNILTVPRRLKMPVTYTLVVYGPQRFEFSLEEKSPACRERRDARKELRELKS
jgi:nicotinamidase-related amidase